MSQYVYHKCEVEGASVVYDLYVKRWILNVHYISLNDDDEYDQYLEVPIKHCPVCGEKLGDDHKDILEHLDKEAKEEATRKALNEARMSRRKQGRIFPILDIEELNTDDFTVIKEEDK
jgi:hypothetical protein